jgi:hypothetical protein
MIGTELQIITPAAGEVLGPDVHRRATLHTNAKTDGELLKVWRLFRRCGARRMALRSGRLPSTPT